MQHSKLPWIVRTNPRDEDYCFVQAPRNKPTDPYDIEVMGEDMNEDLYSPQQKRADAEFIVECVNLFKGVKNPSKYFNEIVDKASRYDNLDG
jgi:hypothetical protein